MQEQVLELDRLRADNERLIQLQVPTDERERFQAERAELQRLRGQMGEVASQPPASLTLLSDEAPVTLAEGPAGPATVTPGQTDRGLWWVPVAFLMGLLAYGLKRLVDHLDRPVEDSDDFGAALDRWSERISKVHTTPRAAKRLLNKLRFYSMMMRALQTAGDAPIVPEDVIVAFGVLEGAITPDLELPPDEWPSDESLGPDILAMVASLQRYPELFRYLRSSVKVESNREEPGSA